MLLKLPAHAPPGVVAHKAEGRLSVGAARLFTADGDAAPVPVILHRVPADVLQHLAQVEGAAQQMGVLNAPGLGLKAQSVGLALHLNDAAGLLQQLRQVKGLVLQHDGARLQPVHIQHVVY